MPNFSLSPKLTNQILKYLGCDRETPSIRYLNRLIQAYNCHVPWESVSRIIKRHTTVDTTLCPRWPEEFWDEALSFGTGGTCFECNLAFYTLLTLLGFTGYLTINDMESPACHTASLISLPRQKYLVDVAIPIYCAIPVHSEKITKRLTQYHHYTIRPVGNSKYRVERSHHPKRYIFTLVDVPVPIEDYKMAVAKDYEEGGYFLDRVIIVKVIGNKLWRFSSMDRPFILESFDKTSKEEVKLTPARLEQSLADCFGIPARKIAAALSYVKLV